MIDHKIPTHVAIIMDGNGRWAEKKLYPRTLGHKSALKNVRSTIQCAVKKKIQILTLFAFGRDNWLRPKKEVDVLMNIFSEMLVSEVPMMKRNNIHLSIVGDRNRLSSDINARANDAELQTMHCNGLQLNIAIDYSGQWEILNAAKKLCESIQAGEKKLDEINEKCLEKFLIKEIQTPVDLLIRTSGEKRISNFMIWQLSYAELYFCKKFWPEFSMKDFQAALNEYQKRIRRFGRTDEQIKKEKK